MRRIWNEVFVAYFYIYWSVGWQFPIRNKECWRGNAVPLRRKDEHLDASNSGGFKCRKRGLKYYLAAVKKTTTTTSHTAVDRLGIRTGCIRLEARTLEMSWYMIHCYYCTKQLVTEMFLSWGVSINLAKKCQRTSKRSHPTVQKQAERGYS